MSCVNDRVRPTCNKTVKFQADAAAGADTRCCVTVPCDFDQDQFPRRCTTFVEEPSNTLRLLVDDGTARIGRVAVEAPRRREGIALRMLLMALERARELGCRRARLAAQLEATELYRRAGFSVESEPFFEAGIEHVWMGQALDDGGSG